MSDKIDARVRRSRATRAKISQLRAVRLTVHRSNTHIYAQVIDPSGGKVLASASTTEADVKANVKYGGNVKAAAEIGRRYGRTEQTVTTWLRRAATKLRRQLGDRSGVTALP